jgi:hypothetical protein
MVLYENVTGRLGQSPCKMVEINYQLAVSALALQGQRLAERQAL